MPYERVLYSGAPLYLIFCNKLLQACTNSPPPWEEGNKIKGFGDGEKSKARKEKKDDFWRKLKLKLKLCTLRSCYIFTVLNLLLELISAIIILAVDVNFIIFNVIDSSLLSSLVRCPRCHFPHLALVVLSWQERQKKDSKTSRHREFSFVPTSKNVPWKLPTEYISMEINWKVGGVPYPTQHPPPDHGYRSSHSPEILARQLRAPWALRNCTTQKIISRWRDFFSYSIINLNFFAGGFRKHMVMLRSFTYT